MKDLFEALYSRLLLRDFTGRVLPGLAVVACLVTSFLEASSLYDHVKELPTFFWVLVFAMGWLSGLAVQSLGERLCLVAVYPKREVAASRWGRSAGDQANSTLHSSTLYDRAYYTALQEFWKGASERDLQQHERFVVIKEACGIGHAALILCLIILLARHICQGDLGAWLLENAIILTYVLLATLALRRFHVLYAKRQWDYVEIVCSSTTNPNTRMDPTAGPRLPE